MALELKTGVEYAYTRAAYRVNNSGKEIIMPARVIKFFVGFEDEDYYSILCDDGSKITLAKGSVTHEETVLAD